VKRTPTAVIIVAVATGIAGLLHGWRETLKRKSIERSLTDRFIQQSQTAPEAQADERTKAEPAPASTTAAPAEDAITVVRRHQQDLARKRANEAIAGAAAQQQLMESKEIQDRIARQFRMNLGLRYGALYAERGWSEEQVATFENALMEKFWTMSDVVMATRKVGSSDQETAELRRQQLAGAEDKLRLALGDQLYREYIGYDTTADARAYIEALAGKVFYKEALSPSQAAQLAALVTSNSTAKRPDEWLRNQVLLGENAVSWTDVDWDAVAGEARKILSPAQLVTLRALAADARLRHDMARRLKEADQRGRESARGSK
jgi:hypothetical protein